MGACTASSPLTEPKDRAPGDRKSTRLNSSHSQISYAVFCLKKKTKKLASIVYSGLRHDGNGLLSDAEGLMHADQPSLASSQIGRTHVCTLIALYYQMHTET